MKNEYKEKLTGKYLTVNVDRQAYLMVYDEKPRSPDIYRKESKTEIPYTTAMDASYEYFSSTFRLSLVL